MGALSGDDGGGLRSRLEILLIVLDSLGPSRLRSRVHAACIRH